MKLKLEYYILGLLTLAPRTGYDVKKHIDTEGRFERRRAPLSQIYTTLKRMTEDNLVTFVEKERDGKPDLKIYSLTPQGQQLLVNFLHSPIKPSFRYGESSLLFRIQYAFLMENKAIIRQIQDEIEFRHEQIRTFRHRNRTIQPSTLPADKLAYAQKIYDQLHGYGATRMDQYVAFLESTLAFFEEQTVEFETALIPTS